MVPVYAVSGPVAPRLVAQVAVDLGVLAYEVARVAGRLVNADAVVAAATGLQVPEGDLFPPAAARHTPVVVEDKVAAAGLDGDAVAVGTGVAFDGAMVKDAKVGNDGDARLLSPPVADSTCVFVL